MEEELINWLLDIYRSSFRFKDIGTFQYVEFLHKKVILRERFAFIFVLTAPHYYSFDVISSQIFFYQNLFLSAFDIKDDESALKLLKELNLIRKRDISEPLIQAYMLWSVLDTHINEVDMRNLIEVFVNIFNAIWSAIIETNNSSLLSSLVEEITTDMFGQCSNSATLLSFTDTSVEILDNKIPNCHKQDLEDELLSILSFVISWLTEHKGINYRREIFAKKLSHVIKMEWYRMLSLDILKPIITLIWS